MFELLAMFLSWTALVDRWDEDEDEQSHSDEQTAQEAMPQVSLSEFLDGAGSQNKLSEEGVFDETEHAFLGVDLDSEDEVLLPVSDGASEPMAEIQAKHSRDDDHHDHEDDHEHGEVTATALDDGVSLIDNQAAVHTITEADVILPEHVTLPDHVDLPESANSPVFDAQSDTEETDGTLSDAKPDHAGGGKNGGDSTDDGTKGGGKGNGGGKGGGKSDPVDEPVPEEPTDPGDGSTGEVDPTPEVLTRYVSGEVGGYNVAINFTGDWTPELQQAFIDSSEYISDLILKDVPDVGGVYAADDIEIEASLVNIDGTGGILGQAGPTVIRTESGLPVEAVMQFDAADAQTYYNAGLWDDIVLHEMLHSVGAGALWGYLGLTQGSVDGGDMRFTGENATAQYQSEFSDLASSDANAALGVPIETDGGSGTAGAHWDEAIFGNELMTGYINQDNYVSGMTVAALEDMGYDTIFDDLNSPDDASGTMPSDILTPSLLIS